MELITVEAVVVDNDLVVDMEDKLRSRCGCMDDAMVEGIARMHFQAGKQTYRGIPRTVLMLELQSLVVGEAVHLQQYAYFHSWTMEDDMAYSNDLVPC